MIYNSIYSRGRQGAALKAGSLLRSLAVSLLVLSVGLVSLPLKADNPLILDQFTADPTARVFDGKLWLFPSHDIISPVEPERKWFCMADYHVFSSSDLTEWTDHGVILDQQSVPWGKKDGFSMWAPDCIFHEGRYCFFFPDAPAGQLRGFAIGVATSDKPEGPYTAMEQPVGDPFAKPVTLPDGNTFPASPNVMGIDPCVLQAPDGRLYLYWGGMGLKGAELDASLTQLASQPVPLEATLPEGFKEGPFVFERNGIYYLTYPWVRKNTETLAYATSDNPLGPFEYRGIIMAESPTGCWTNHHSIVEYEGQWYLFYHHNDCSPSFDKNRSVCADSLFFEPDGSIREVHPTHRGVGLARATGHIQVDRYYSASDDVEVNLLDTLNGFGGWFIHYPSAGSMSRYTQVSFPRRTRWVELCYRCDKRSRVSVTAGDKSRKVTLRPTKDEWKKVRRRLRHGQDVCDLQIELRKGSADIDWITFR